MTSTSLRSCAAARAFRRVFRLGLAGILLAATTALSLAQAADGRISGRIFNPATQQYVRNAEIRVDGTDLVTYSGDDGSYVLTGIPGGEVGVTVTFTGYDVARSRVDLSTARSATKDFELQGSTYAGRKDDVVKLESFVVSSEREGNAKAIMDQRAALNMKNVVATDNFGEVTSGNIGEFVKYMPGVVIDYTQSDARAARIGGLDPKYVGISMDGMRMANAASASFGSASRGFEFEQASINSIESIEISKTLTASMDADAPAGSINLKSKNAFDRKGREVVADLTYAANTYAFYLHKSPGPDDGKHYKAFPGLKLSYSESFGGRFGVQLNVGTNIVYTEQENGTTNYDFSNPTRGPFITQLTFRNGPKITRRDSFGANFDYKISDRLSVSLRTAGSHLNDEYINRTIAFIAAAAQIDPSSTLTRVVANPTANANTRMEQSQGHRNRLNDTVTYTPKLTYKFADITANVGGGYSRSRTHYLDISGGFFNNVIARLTRMGWSAERDSTIQPGWRMTQTSGRPWSDPNSLGRDDLNPNNVRSREFGGQNQIFMGFVDGKKTFNVAGLPVAVMAGGKVRLTTHDVENDNSSQWTYVGPGGTLASQTSAVFPIHLVNNFDPKVGGNMTQLNLPYVDPTKMQKIYLDNPSWFIPDTVGNFRTALAAPRGLKEQVDSYFVEASTRWNKLRLNLGARNERTRTVGKVFEIIPGARIPSNLTPNTIPYINYQYSNGRKNQYGEYDNLFLSGGAKYEFTRNFVLQVSAAQSILRPNYDNLAGVITIDDVNRRATVPNPNLKPETSDKYFVSLQYYLEPAGTISVSTYELNIKNLSSTARRLVSAAEAGYGDDPLYEGYTFSQVINVPGTQKMKGVDVEYSQQLVFLPKFWRGLSVFGSLSRTISELQLVGVVPKAANGGIRYSNHKFNVQIRGTWQSAKIDGFATNEIRWQAERFLVDFSGGYKINRTYEVTLSGRNITDAFQDYYSNQPGLLRSREILGPIWTLGIRGRF